MAEQSAVQWLESNFPKIGKSIDTATSLEIHLKFQQAERMHEQQIKDAYGHGHNNGLSYLYGCVPIDAEQYYNETYNTQAQ